MRNSQELPKPEAKWCWIDICVNRMSCKKAIKKLFWNISQHWKESIFTGVFMFFFTSQQHFCRKRRSDRCVANKYLLLKAPVQMLLLDDKKCQLLENIDLKMEFQDSLIAEFEMMLIEWNYYSMRRTRCLIHSKFMVEYCLRLLLLLPLFYFLSTVRDLAIITPWLLFEFVWHEYASLSIPTAQT